MAGSAPKQGIIRKQAGGSRPSGEQRFESMVNAIDGIVWEIELPAWKFTFVSKQAERILGHPLKQWKDPNFWADHLHPDDRSSAMDFSRTATDKGENHQFEYRMIAAGGRIVWLRDIVTVELRRGRPACRRGVMVDITERRAAEEDRERLEMALRQMPGGVMVVEAGTGKLLIANEGVERIWRRPPTDLSELPEHPLSRSILTGEMVRDEERRIERGDGTPGQVSISSVPVRDSEGKIVAGVALLLDITGREDEQAFHTGQKRVLEMIASAAPLPETLKSILHLIELQSNGMLCSILLLGEDGLHVRHGAAPSLPEGYLRAIDGAPIGPKAGSCGTAMYRGTQVIVTDILTDPLWEDYRVLAQAFGLRACWSTPILSPDGAVLGSFAMYYHEPRRPNAGEMRLTSVATHLAGIAIERQRAEHALRRSEEKYRRIVDTANEGIWVVEDDTRIVFVNNRMAEMLGYSVDEMVGRSALDFIGDASRDEADRRAERRRAGIGEQFDLNFRRKDGSDLWGIVSTTPVPGEDGQFGSALGMVTDITGRKRAEDELRRSSEQIREMAGKLINAQEEERRRIARELHDDIVQKIAVLAITMSRLKQKLPAGEPMALEMAAFQQRIYGLAEDVRQLSHQLHPALLEHAGLRVALASFTEEFKRLEGIDVGLAVPENNDAIPREISVCVYRVVQESLRNVAKHAQAKRAEVTLAIEDNTLLLTVKDEGQGFETDPARGEGLGLVNIRERIHLCRGTVEITSQLNRGTTLMARIPLAPAP
jgi:PAS domain S-box-containing protein